MCVGLHFADLLGYRNIVLLGVDLHTPRHFYDDHEVLKEERNKYNTFHRDHSEGLFESMIPKGNQFRTMEEYYYAVNQLYFRPKGVNLYVGNASNTLCPAINEYPEFHSS
jgi:hypothetical protein